MTEHQVIPKRITIADACEMLSVGPATVRSLIRAGTLTAIRPSGQVGVGRRVYLDPKEVELYALGKFDELTAYQASKLTGAA